MTSKVNNENSTSAARYSSTARRIPLFPNEPQTLAELFRSAAEKHERGDALNYKRMTDGILFLLGK
jgi:hypothetical protein